MPKTGKENTKLTAADQYRAAFERLKANCPTRLPVGTPVSQNNVAKEAGSDPSALKKSRFPLIIEEIQRYVTEHGGSLPTSVRQVTLASRKKNRGLKEQLAEVTGQRDHLASLLAEADIKIIELIDELAEYRKDKTKSNVVGINPRSEKSIRDK